MTQITRAADKLGKSGKSRQIAGKIQGGRGESPLGSGRATEACVEAGGEERTEQERRLRTWVSSSSSNDVASSLRIVSNHVANSVRIVSLVQHQNGFVT